MAMHVLSARQVQVAPVGSHQDGAGLNLVVTERGANWVFRFTAPDGRRREMGLGPARRDTLAASGASITLARKSADKARDQLAMGVDPIEHKRSERAAAHAKVTAAKSATKAERLTLCRCARTYHEQTVEPRRTTKHAAQWLSSLEQGIPPAIWHKAIAEVTQHELLDALAALQLRVPETASRVRQRLDAVFADAIFHGYCSTNPAAIIKRKLSERPVGREKGHFAALPYAEVPDFVKALRQQPGTAAKALEFALLCAARTGEVIECQWAEIDTQADVWRIPGARMKGGEDHIVYLSPSALEIVEALRETQGEPFVFPSPRNRSKAMSNMAMLAVVERMGLDAVTTVHGVCRSSFSTWANDTAAARPDVIEACLAHREADAVRRAYNRASFAAERRALLLAWAAYCNGEQPAATERPSATVHPLPIAA